jgi:hypothetical protein
MQIEKWSVLTKGIPEEGIWVTAGKQGGSITKCRPLTAARG